MPITDNIKNFFRSRSKSNVEPIEELQTQQSEAKDLNSQMNSFGSDGFGSFGSTGNFSGLPLSGGAKYSRGLSGDGRGHLIDHRRTLQNARTAYHETPEAKAIVDRFADTVIGPGLRIEPTPSFKILGMTIEEAEQWSEDVAERYDLYLQSKQGHRRESMSGYQLSRLYQIQQQRDNDIFARFYYSNESRLMNPLQVDFIDPDQIMGNPFTTTTGNLVDFQDGIKKDAKGREKSYLVWVTDNQGRFKSIEIPRIGEKSKKVFMTHGFSPEYSYQTRGYSRLSYGLQELQKMTDLSLSVILKAVNQSMIAMTVESETDAPGVNPFEGQTLTARTAGPRQGLAPLPESGSTPEEGIPAEAELNASYNEIAETTNRVPGSMGVFNLEGKQKLKPFKTESTADEYDKLHDTFLMNLSAASSMPVEVLRLRFGNNYSSSRGVLIMFWQIVQIWLQEQTTDFENPRYEAWLSGEIAIGRITAPGWSDPILRQAWLKCNWIGVPMPNIDPMKTMAADRGYIEMGVTTQEKVTKAANGGSIKANLEKNRKSFAETTLPPWHTSVSQNISVVTNEIDEMEE